MRRIAAILVCLASLAPSASALTVVETRWGFDGRVVPGRMNVLSALVVNESATPFDGVLRLEHVAGLAGRIGAVHEQDCYVAAKGARWVQFYTLNGEKDEEWALWWGRSEKERKSLSTRIGPPARVFLSDPARVVGAAVQLKTFPDDIFPATVAATDGLAEVVLDHVPRWEPARREAFMDWLRRGGTVHVLLDIENRFPVFSGEMSPLNAGGRVGAGRVVRHDLRREQVSDATFRLAGFPALTLARNTQYWALRNVEEVFVRRMTTFTRPRHSWGAIYLLIVVYIVLVGPVNYLLGRRWRDWRRTTLLYLSIVGAACLVLGYIGRRGHGESAAAHKIVYARSLGGASWDVTQWVNAFVTSGGDYVAEYPAAANLFAAITQLDLVPGVVRSGPGGTFTCDMPLFSSRAFLHRGKMTGPDLGLRLLDAGDDRADSVVRLACGSAFPSSPLSMRVLAGRRLATLERRGDVLESARLTSAALTEEQLSVNENQPDEWPGRRRGSGEESPEVNPAEVFGGMRATVMGYALGGTKGFYYRWADMGTLPLPGTSGTQVDEDGVVTTEADFPTPLDEDVVQVFVFARAPEEFALLRNPFGREPGYVLYHVILPRPER